MRYVITLFSVLIYFYSFSQNNIFQLKITGGLNVSNATFGSIENVDYKSLKQWPTPGIGWTIRPQVFYKISKQVSFFSGIRLVRVKYIHKIESKLSFNPNGLSFIKSSVKYISLGIPFGANVLIKNNFSFQFGFTYYHNSVSKVKGELIESGVEGSVQIGEGKYHEISKNNFGSEIGVLFYPSKLFNKKNNHFFFLTSLEYYFLADTIYFSDSSAKKITANLLIGLKI